MQMTTWKVVPLSPGQLRDVRDEDILEDGLYRICHTYRGGGGYDHFPRIAADRLGLNSRAYDRQFIVQLAGCNLDCPYCYVTREGVWGKWTGVPTEELVNAFVRSRMPVFHLMGGAPALNIKRWPGLLDELFQRVPGAVFHSDMMLTEQEYHADTLVQLTYRRCIFAINVKGLTQSEHQRNTRKPLDWDRFWRNWLRVERSGVSAYVTFTGVDVGLLPAFWRAANLHGVDVDFWNKSAYVIDLIDYAALEYVDRVPWGKQ